MSLEPGDRLVDALVLLAQQNLNGDPPRGQELAAPRRLEQRMARSTRSRFEWHGRTARAGFAALAVAASVGLWLALRTPDLTYQVVNGSDRSGTVTGTADTRVRFSDGSVIALQHGTEARIEDLDARGGRVDLRQGSLRVSIRKAPEAAWFVDAGPYTVRVTGTAFDVRWSDRERLFELALHTGSVVVTGPSGRYQLQPGQRLLARGERPVVVANDADPPRAERAAQGPSKALGFPDSDPTTPSEDLAPATNASRHSTPRSGSRAADTRTWRRQVAEGHFDEVLAAAESRGLAQTLSTASLDDLSALADAARYARRTALAERVLGTLRARFPRSPAARDAAFFLGRLSQGSTAVGWYDRYLAETPGGPWASQALGRKMMLVYEELGAAEARGIALDYLTRYPKGAYASVAGKIDRETAER